MRCGDGWPQALILFVWVFAAFILVAIAGAVLLTIFEGVLGILALALGGAA